MLSRVNNPVFLLVCLSMFATGLILFHVHNSLFNYDRFDLEDLDRPVQVSITMKKNTLQTKN